MVETISCGAIAAQSAGAPWLLESLVIPQRTGINHHFHLAASNKDAEATVKELAQAIRARTGSHYGLAQWWSFNQLALNDSTSIIRLHQALDTPAALHYDSVNVTGSASRKQSVAAIRALDMVRRVLHGYL